MVSRCISTAKKGKRPLHTGRAEEVAPCLHRPDAFPSLRVQGKLLTAGQYGICTKVDAAISEYALPYDGTAWRFAPFQHTGDLFPLIGRRIVALDTLQCFAVGTLTFVYSTSISLPKSFCESTRARRRTAAPGVLLPVAIFRSHALSFARLSFFRKKIKGSK